MKEIGGYFELELPDEGVFPHSSGILLNSGRHALEYFLTTIEGEISGIVLPYYTCEAVIQPIDRLGIDRRFYHIGADLRISSDVQLKRGEYIIINNYYGLFDSYIKEMIGKYGSRVIVDNTQAWYAPELKNIATIYSPRKFFGVPDGGILTGVRRRDAYLERDYSYDRCMHLLKRIDSGSQSGYQNFKDVSHSIAGSSVKSMSNLTYRLLSSIDYEKVKYKRRLNFAYLSENLSDENLLSIPSEDSFSCPMVYPFVSERMELRQYLINHKVFVATYWPDVLEWCEKDSVEASLVHNLLPIPIDQRYGEEEMAYIVKLIKDFS